MTQTKQIHDQILIEDFRPLVSIGVFEREKLERQHVSISIQLDIQPLPDGEAPSAANFVRYDDICDQIDELIADQHFDLVETLAESIAAICLAHSRSLSVNVTVLKPDAIDRAQGVGVRIERHKTAA